jgi:transcriptional regulator with XRE-family HTH domain
MHAASYADLVEPVPVIFGRQVRAARQKLGWTQERLARECGKHPTYIGGIERGERNPTLTVAQAIASALGRPLADLIKEDG